MRLKTNLTLSCLPLGQRGPSLLIRRVYELSPVVAKRRTTSDGIGILVRLQYEPQKPLDEHRVNGGQESASVDQMAYEGIAIRHHECVRAQIAMPITSA